MRMRVDAVNSWLSASPPLYFTPIAPIGHHGQHIPESAPKTPVRIALPVHTDTMSHTPYDPLFQVCDRVNTPNIDTAEQRALLALIAQQSRRTDYLLSSFPGLVKA